MARKVQARIPKISPWLVKRPARFEWHRAAAKIRLIAWRTGKAERDAAQLEITSAAIERAKVLSGLTATKAFLKGWSGTASTNLRWTTYTNT